MLKRIAIVAAVLVTASACGSSSSDTTAGSPSPSDTAAAGCSYTASGSPAKDAKLPGPRVDPAKTHVTLDTNRGTIKLTLDATNTPCTTNSLVSLASQHYFDATTCHRLVDSGIFVLQCGDPSGTGSGGPGYEFNDELPKAAQPKSCDAATGGCTYPAGTVAMANAGPNTNGSQFFLVYEDSPLPYDYTIFGQMDAASLEVVRQIAAHGSGAADMYGNTPPIQSVTIIKATVN